MKKILIPIGILGALILISIGLFGLWSEGQNKNSSLARLSSPYEEYIAGGVYTLAIDKAIAAERGVDVSSAAMPELLATSFEVLERRLEAMYTRDCSITTNAEGLLVVRVEELPANLEDQVLETLLRKGSLTFQVVHADNDALVSKIFEQDKAPYGYQLTRTNVATASGGSYPSTFFVRDTKSDPSAPQDIRAFAHVSPEYDFMLQRESRSGVERFVPYYVNAKAELTGEHIEQASYGIDNTGQPNIHLLFTSAGRQQFGELTAALAPGGARNPKDYDRRAIAIVLDGILLSAPYIMEPILGGTAEVSGDFTLAEAVNMAALMEGGALPVPLKLLKKEPLADVPETP